ANVVISGGGLGQLIARHTSVRYSAKDGLQFNANGTGSILNSQIVSNSLVVTATHGVYRAASPSAVLATNNWWGDPNGPKSDIGCGTGQGDKVTAGVLFQPVLTNTNLSAEFPLSDAPQLTLTPQRWFAPADGVSKIYFDLTLRDGNGAPLAGEQIRLHTTRGTVADGGFTDPKGHALGYIVANNGDVGDANVSATVDGFTGCVGVMSPVAKVTFTAPLNVTDLFPNSPAPYFANDLSITPMPIVTGITETIHAKLTNPLTVPITVDVEFGFAQSSIGLLFGPIKDITQTIPASSTIALSADFMPLVSGHYCVQVSYAITAIGSTQLLRPQAGRQLKQFNFNPEQGPTMTPSDKDSLDKADKAFNKVKKLSPRGTNIQQGIVSKWWGWVKDSAKKISKSLGGDPPRQDYNVATVPIWYRWPHTQPDANISQARAAAMNAASDALADVVAYGTAADTALDRYGGASQAQDLTWAAQQANAQIFYEQQMGTALLTYADKLDAFVQVLNDEHETHITVSVGDAINYQQSLSSTGFTTQEIADAKLVGLTDDDIEAIRQEIIATDPNDLAGNILDMYFNEAFVSRNLGNALLHPYAFSPGGSVGGTAGLKPTAVLTVTGNTLAQIGNIVTTIPLSNSLAQTSTLVSVVARRIDLPADWAVTVSPAQVTLGPGQQTTVTVSILTGSPAPQGSVPRVAVEGYANNQLLGGVVVDVIVPNDMPYFLQTYLPVIKK
ncbi:MAG TPA: Ig-like domain-containing protein, partial [Anaerolineae bacterium]|nr:Ig-like domain-containing protein [Anaerolineae bacterium]